MPTSPAPPPSRARTSAPLCSPRTGSAPAPRRSPARARPAPPPAAIGRRSFRPAVASPHQRKRGYAAKVSRTPAPASPPPKGAPAPPPPPATASPPATPPPARPAPAPPGAAPPAHPEALEGFPQALQGSPEALEGLALAEPPGAGAPSAP